MRAIDKVVVSDDFLNIICCDDRGRIRGRLREYIPSELLVGRVVRQVNCYAFDEMAISFLYRGPVPPLLDALAASAPVDVRIEEASLEDVFLADFAPAASKEASHAA